MSYRSALKSYLESYVSESEMYDKYDICHCELGSPEFVEYSALCKKNEEMKRELVAMEGTLAHGCYFTGIDSVNDHYDVDDALKAEFGSAYTADSESGTFFGYCHHGIKNKVLDFMLEKFPTLSVSCEDHHELAIHNPSEFKSFCVYVPGAGNWSTAKKTLEIAKAAERELGEVK